MPGIWTSIRIRSNGSRLTASTPCGAVGGGLDAGAQGLQHLGGDQAVGGVVLDHQHPQCRPATGRRRRRIDGLAGSATGAAISNQKVEPSPSLADEPRRRPSSRPAARVMARPRPVPPNWRVRRAVGLLEALEQAVCGLLRDADAGVLDLEAQPLSRAAAGRASAATSTPPSRVNFTALPIRLNSIWRRRTGSTETQPTPGAISVAQPQALGFGLGPQQVDDAFQGRRRGRAARATAPAGRPRSWRSRSRR